MLRIIVLFQLHPNSGVLIIQGLPGQLGQPGSKGDTGDPGEDGRNVRHILLLPKCFSADFFFLFSFSLKKNWMKEIMKELNEIMLIQSTT